MFENFSWIRRLSQLGPRLQMLFCGKPVGVDGFGNRYFQQKAKTGLRARRWVLYKGEPDASKVPPSWHGWLHYTRDEPIKADSPLHHAWQKPHQPNLSGTPDAYLPAWHSLSQDKEIKTPPAYQAWKP